MTPNVMVELLLRLLRIWKAPGSNMAPENDYPQALSWFFSVTICKYQNSTSDQTNTACFRISFESCFTINPQFDVTQWQIMTKSLSTAIKYAYINTAHNFRAVNKLYVSKQKVCKHQHKIPKLLKLETRNILLCSPPNSMCFV